MGIERFEDLIAWQKARELTRQVYLLTRKEEFFKDFGLRDQIRRAAVSVMSNIAEGFERGSTAEYHQFVVIAKGSCAEVRSQLYVGFDAGYITEAEFGVGTCMRGRTIQDYQRPQNFVEEKEDCMTVDPYRPIPSRPLFTFDFSLGTFPWGHFMKDKRITITGGKGFLGSHLIRQMQQSGYRHLAIADLPDYNLVSSVDVRRLYEELKPDIVIHLAAKVGGIGFNQENPASLFYENAMMGIQLLHEGYVHGIEKFVALGTICAYPKFTPVPFKEDDIWNGYPEETNAPYGLAKKMMLVQSQAYRQQYGFNSIFLLPVNLYGPGDNFDPKSSHVIPALIKKCMDAMRSGEDEIVVWGTGKATREFFYVEDAADAIIRAMETYNKSEPVNIGAGFEISIRDLVDLIVELTGFQGKVVWDGTKPDGQPRRMLDTTRAREEFGFRAKTGFREGLQKTIEWYRQAGR